MSDNNVNENTETMADALKSVTTVKIGDTVKADVLAVEDKQLIVGIEGTGVEGVVPIKELSTQPIDDIHDVAKVGDKLDLVVLSTVGKDKENGQFLLSKRRLEAQKVWKEIQAKYEAGETITAPVTSVVKGGVLLMPVFVASFLHPWLKIILLKILANTRVRNLNSRSLKSNQVKIV